MKRMLLLFASVVLAQFITAQPTLTSKTHALLPGEDNPMTLCKYLDPGIAGSNTTWDFSKLEVIEKFTGSVNSVIADNNFSSADVVLDEFGTSFFFKSDENSLEQVGYTSKDTKTVVQYTRPFQKMVFLGNRVLR